ncbi:MAG: hypothetical protein HFI93_09300 [Lachnospiraceae bacterium]|nr:hypothetical protein [Lachnospiraceae bacterium]
MKKLYALTVFAALCVLLTGAYYASYRYSMRHPAEEEPQTPGMFSGFLENVPGAMQEKTEENRPAMQAEEPFVTEKMSYTRITKNQLTGEEITEEEAMPVALLGLTREEIIAYLQEETEQSYADRDSRERTHYELISFAGDSVTVQETVLANPDQYECFLIIEGDYVNVYTSDRTALYMDTMLLVSEFSEEAQEELRRGIYMETVTDLYDFLQNYSS